MNNTTSRRRYSARAAAVATAAAVIFGVAACGSETASDNGQAPAAPAPAAKADPTPRPPISADAAERKARAEQLEQYRRHLLGSSVQAEPSVKVRRQPNGHPSHPLP